MEFDQYKIKETKGVEGTMQHLDYPNIVFNKSCFLKEWSDKYCQDVLTVLDIGALEGGDSLRFASWYPQATVYAIEASIHNFKAMNEKLGNKYKIETFNQAMTDVDDQTITFYEQTYNDQNGQRMVIGSIYDRKPIGPLTPDGEISIGTITYDTFCKNNNIDNVDVVHMDVEGATYDILLGMNEVLPKLIFTEKDNIHLYKNKTTGGESEVKKLLNEKGYELVVELGNDYLFYLK